LTYTNNTLNIFFLEGVNLRIVNEMDYINSIHVIDIGIMGYVS